ncbi:cytochrome P450 [Hypoxylon sp. NC1633]|nr:cytochrome P450 [Hypoxylon sp. NC1633]
MWDAFQTSESSTVSQVLDSRQLRLSIWSLLFIFVFSKFGCLLCQTDSREPPKLNSTFPIVGHIWGLIRRSHGYFNDLHHKSSLPIYTLPLLHRKIYVINSPDLVQSAFANKNLSFSPFIVDFVKRMDELSPFARQAYPDMHPKVMQCILSYMTGKHLKKMSSVQLDELFQKLPISGPGLEVENLWFWLRDNLTVGTTSMLFGARHNPWKKNPSLVQAYWNYEEGGPSRRFNLLAIGNRSITNYHAMMVAALEEYFAAGYDLSSEFEDSDVSQMIRETAAMQRGKGFGNRDIAAAHVAVTHGSLVSAAPTVFWLVAYTFSQPELLERLRQDALAAVTFEDNYDTGTRRVLVLNNKIESLCPLLVAALRETQRLVTVGLLHRRTLRDTELIDNTGESKRTYILKKGIAIFLPAIPNHCSPLPWGEAPEEFRIGRFDMTSQNPLEAQQPTRSLMHLRKKSYYPFGGGKELCPGRNFAITEALSTLVVLVLGFDIMAVDGTTLKLPQFSPPKMTASVSRPHKAADLKVRISRREGWENVIWGVSPD